MFAVVCELAATGVSWIGIAYLIAGAGVFIYGIGFVIWNESIKPRLIPREEIARLADDVVARHTEFASAWLSRARRQARRAASSSPSE